MISLRSIALVILLVPTVAARAGEVRVTGRVVDARLEAAVGALVRVVDDPRPGPLDLSDAAAGASAVTDANGKFSMDFAATDGVAVHAELAGGGTAVVRRRRPGDDGRLDAGVLELATPVAIRGRVVDA